MNFLYKNIFLKFISQFNRTTITTFRFFFQCKILELINGSIMTLTIGKFFYQKEHQIPTLSDVIPSHGQKFKNKPPSDDYDFTKFLNSTYRVFSTSTTRQIPRSGDKHQHYDFHATEHSRNPFKPNYSKGQGLNFDYTTDSDFSKHNKKKEKHSKNYFSNIITEPPETKIYMQSSNHTNNHSDNNSYKNPRDETSQTVNIINTFDNGQDYTTNKFEGPSLNTNNFNDFNTTQPRQINKFSSQNSNNTNVFDNNKSYTINRLEDTATNLDRAVGHSNYTNKTNNVNPIRSSGNISSTSHVNKESSYLRESIINPNTNYKTNNNIYLDTTSKASTTNSVFPNSSSNLKYQAFDYTNAETVSALKNLDLNDHKSSSVSTSSTANYPNSHTKASIQSYDNNKYSTNKSISQQFIEKTQINQRSQIPQSVRAASSTTKSTVNQPVQMKEYNHNQPIPSSITQSKNNLQYSQQIPSKEKNKLSNSRFTEEYDYKNQNNNIVNRPSSINKINTNSMQHYTSNEIGQPNLTNYVRPTSIASNEVKISKISNDTPFVASHTGSNQLPSELLAKKTLIRNETYSANIENFGNSNNEVKNESNHNSIQIDPIPKKTRVEFPEPQTAPIPLDIMSKSLDGDFSQEAIKKVEQLNELMKSFDAGSDSDEIPQSNSKSNSNINSNQGTESKIPIINPEDLKKGLFSSDLFEEEEEEKIITDQENINDSDSFDSIEKKLKDFSDDSQKRIENKEEITENKDKELEVIPSNQESPNNSLIKSIKNINTEEHDEIDLQEDKDEYSLNSDEYQDILKKYGIEEEEEELIKKLENFDLEATKHLHLKDNNNEDTLENAFKGEEEDDSYIIPKQDDNPTEKSNIDFEDQNDQIPEINVISNNDIKQTSLEEEDEEETNFDDLSLEQILKDASAKGYLNDNDDNSEYEEEDEPQEIQTLISRLKNPLKFVMQNINIYVDKTDGGIELAHDLADQILKEQLNFVLGI